MKKEKMVIHIEESEPSNLPALRNLFLEFKHDISPDRESIAPEASDFEKNTEGELILIATVNQKVVGFVTIWLDDNFVHHLYVEKAYQKRGIGTQLLSAAIQKCGSPIRLKCLESNIGAIEFYRKMGFVCIEKGITNEGEYLLFQLSHYLK